MKAGKWIVGLVLVIGIALLTQQVFVANVPHLVFGLAKQLSKQPLNTLIHAPVTNAELRRVVLPNPDFIYTACFYDVSSTDVVIEGEWPDKTQYCCLAFYNNQMQPYYVMNNQTGRQGTYRVTITSGAPNLANNIIQPPNKQGSLLMRVLVTDSADMATALRLQQVMDIEVIPR